MKRPNPEQSNYNGIIADEQYITGCPAASLIRGVGPESLITWPISSPVSRDPIITIPGF